VHTASASVLVPAACHSPMPGGARGYSPVPSYVPSVAGVANRYSAATPSTPFITPQAPSYPSSPRPCVLAEPKPPPTLTAGLPDPVSVDRQKNAYSRGLDDQLKHGTDVLAQQLKQQSEYLAEVGAQQKRQYMLAVDQEIKQQEMMLAQQHNEQLLMLQQAAQQQKSALEQQANALVLEYNQKKAQEELLQKQYEYAQEHYELQLKYQEELRDLQAQQKLAAQEAAQRLSATSRAAPSAPKQATGGRPPPWTASSGSIASARGSCNGGSYVGLPSAGPTGPSASVVLSAGSKGPSASVVLSAGPRRASSYAPPAAPPAPPSRMPTVQHSPTYYAPLQSVASASYVPPTYAPSATCYGQAASSSSPMRSARIAPATSYASQGGDAFCAGPYQPAPRAMG